MKSWVPLLEIFVKSQTPESEASEWLQQSFNASSSISTTSFLSLLSKPCNLFSPSSSNSTPSHPKRVVMYIETFPSMVQSRILSFLLYERKRFCGRDLARLARGVLHGAGGVDFWVKRAACNLLDVVSESSYEWISGLDLDSSGEDGMMEGKFGLLPDWLKDKMGSCELALPWLPLSGDQLDSKGLFENCGEDSLSQVGETEEDEEEGEDFVEEVVQMKFDRTRAVYSDSELERIAASLRARVANFESTSSAFSLANEIRGFCLERGGDSFVVLGMIEAWRADDETAAVLISHLSQGNEDQLGWPSQILSSIALPKLLALEVPVSRVLLTALLEFCKLNQTATVYALLFPLMLRRDGINNALCDVVTRILKECLHPGHVSAFCHKLLCGDQDERRIFCLPCHKHFISEELVWTESLFNLFQNILNYNVNLTQDSVDCIVYHVQILAERFSRSLKFGNFLLCLVMKCPMSLREHKLSLIKAGDQTNTLVTKSLLSKLEAL